MSCSRLMWHFFHMAATWKSSVTTLLQLCKYCPLWGSYPSWFCSSSGCAGEKASTHWRKVTSYKWNTEEPTDKRQKIQNPQINPHNSIEILFMQSCKIQPHPKKNGKHTDTSEDDKKFKYNSQGFDIGFSFSQLRISFVVDLLSQLRKWQWVLHF